jgi:HsdM N-terminal domain
MCIFLCLSAFIFSNSRRGATKLNLHNPRPPRFGLRMTRIQPSSFHGRNATHPQDIAAKLWHLCNILRDAGITYPEYVTELTYLLFLRMAEETGSEAALPKGYRWGDLTSKSESQQFPFYKRLLRALGSSTRGRVREIFQDAETCLQNPKYLSLLVKEFGRID